MIWEATCRLLIFVSFQLPELDSLSKESNLITQQSPSREPRRQDAPIVDRRRTASARRTGDPRATQVRARRPVVPSTPAARAPAPAPRPAPGAALDRARRAGERSARLFIPWRRGRRACACAAPRSVAGRCALLRFMTVVSNPSASAQAGRAAADVDEEVRSADGRRRASPSQGSRRCAARACSRVPALSTIQTHARPRRPRRHPRSLALHVTGLTECDDGNDLPDAPTAADENGPDQRDGDGSEFVL